MSYKNWFNFSTGKVVEENTRNELIRLAKLEENHGKSNPSQFTVDGRPLDEAKKNEYANYRYGRITCYGITLQLYNDTDNNPDENRASKGMKGFSLPAGDITFDLNFSSEATSGKKPFDGSDTEYTAILWDYNENVPAEQSWGHEYDDPGDPDRNIPPRGTVTTPKDGNGNGGRNLYWDGETRSTFAKGAAPSNYIAYHDGCYYGGDWMMVNENGSPADLGQIANPIEVTGTGEDTTYHFSISDYDFDFDD